MTFIIIALAAIGLGGFLSWWLLIESEGVYLGKRVVIWLYDVYARRYDAIKQFNPHYEHHFLAQPLMAQISPCQNPLVLDVATGTGRLPLALWQHTCFSGHVVGLDLSYQMLKQAHQKLVTEHYREGVSLVHHSAERLPFDDASFDVVTCLEALEFLPATDSALAEMARVLREGGILLITQRINTRWMPGRLWSESTLMTLLEELGFEFIEFDIWQYDYKKVWAQKRGQSAPIGPKPISTLLRHTSHGQTWRQDEMGIYRLLIADNPI